MLELEENKRDLIALKEKIKSVGDSLWHCYTRKQITKFTRKDKHTSDFGKI